MPEAAKGAIVTTFTREARDIQPGDVFRIQPGNTPETARRVRTDGGCTEIRTAAGAFVRLTATQAVEIVIEETWR